MTNYYQQCLGDGEEFQDHVIQKMLFLHGRPICQFSSRRYQMDKGESSNGFEIKLDRMFRRTDHLYIEVAEKSHPDNPEFVPSGIFRPDNTRTWLIGDREGVFEISKTFLMTIYKDFVGKNERFRKVDNPTSQGFLVPVSFALKYTTYWDLRDDTEKQAKE